MSEADAAPLHEWLIKWIIFVICYRNNMHRKHQIQTYQCKQCPGLPVSVHVTRRYYPVPAQDTVDHCMHNTDVHLNHTTKSPSLVLDVTVGCSSSSTISRRFVRCLRRRACLGEPRMDDGRVLDYGYLRDTA